MASSNSIIPCSSSSSHTKMTYDVFVSFRGEDTRNNFTDFLFQALRRNGIDAFKDDSDLKKGESIAPELLQAIQASRLFLVVFSKNYASSTWCLRELSHISHFMTTFQRPVLPIFYDVDPSDVRKQSGSYEEAFAKYEESFRGDKEKMEEVQRWREVLTNVANLSGWHIGNKPQHAQIDEIVHKVINLLGPKFSSLPNDNLVGIESRVEELTKILHVDSVDNVRVVGISGMGGIGKTTLARALYERIYHQYDFHCFIDDVSKIYQDSSTLGVQKQLLSQSLNEKNLEICNVSEGTCWAWTRLCNVRALIVLDNVYQVEQLRMFSGNRETILRECLGGGSRIIIISRDEHILRTYGVDDVYQVHPLNRENAVQLFCRNDFKGNYILSDFEALTHDILSHADGHPLAIEVFGSSLFGRSIPQWRSALCRLSENKSKKIIDVLRVSFDELDDMEKDIFLDIACLFDGRGETRYLKEILDFRGFHPDFGLQVLVDKSLITMDQNLIYMNDLLRDLGRCIVKEISPKEPRKWSRLWDCKDLHQVMLDNMVAENIEAIRVDIPEDFPHTISVDALSKMSHLELLILEVVKYYGSERVNFSGSLNYLSNQLGYLTWKEYPFDSLPQFFHPYKLVELFLHDSNIKKLWEDTKPLYHLRRLDLSGSQNLIEMPNLSMALNLESVCLKGCVQLKEIDASIGLLRKLTILDMENCKSLIKLPPFGEVQNLEVLNLGGCIQLSEIDPSIGLLKKLTFLNLKNCKNLVSLPSSIFGLNSLEYLNLSDCSKLYNIQLLNDVKNVEHSKKNCLYEAPICSPSTWSVMKRWFTWPLHLLYSGRHGDFVSFLLPSSLTFSCMRELDLSFCNLLQIPAAIGNLHFLERLYLMGNNFATLPSLKELSKLVWLNLNHCKRLKCVPKLPLQTDMSSLHYNHENFLSHISKLQRGLNIFNCPELVEKEHCMSMCFSWIMQMVQVDHQYYPVECCSLLWPSHYSSIVPGSIIPRWFNNQHLGNGCFINIKDASHLMQLDNNWIGFACTAIFVVRNGRGMGLPESERRYRVKIPLHFRADLVTDESDHMLIFYYNRPHFIKICKFRKCLGALKLGFEVYENEKFHVEVKKYGYRWIYEEDLQLSSLTMMSNENPLPRKRKFLAIEENK